jgi:hypothetical protein
LRITVQPAASAGATFQEARLNGDGNRLPLDLRCPTRVVLVGLDRHRDVDPALEQRLSVVQGFDERDLVLPLLQPLGQLPHQTPALPGRHLSPIALERLPRRPNGPIDVGRVGLGDLGDHLGARRVDHLRSRRPATLPR